MGQQHPMPIIPQTADQTIQRDNLAATIDALPGQQVLAENAGLKLSATPAGLVVSRQDTHIAVTAAELALLHKAAQHSETNE